MRCRACNRVLTVFEMKEDDEEDHGLCATCRKFGDDGIHMDEIRVDEFMMEWDWDDDED